MICPRCGAQNADTAAFCSLCLVRFRGPEIAPASGPVPEPVRADSASEVVGKKCAYCMTDLTAHDEVLFCGACGIPHHEDCWNENGGCATFGCLAADYESLTGPAAQQVAGRGIDGLEVLVATFSSVTQWSGRAITFANEVFTLQDHGPISAVDVLGYDTQGQLLWANDLMRAWVESKAVAGHLVSEGPLVIATFGTTTAWAGKVITYQEGLFTLQDYGPINSVDVLRYDQQGHLIWADSAMRALVESLARVSQSDAPQTASIGSSLSSGWAKIAASAGAATVAVGKAAEAAKVSFAQGRLAAQGSPVTSDPHEDPSSAAEGRSPARPASETPPSPAPTLATGTSAESAATAASTIAAEPTTPVEAAPAQAVSEARSRRTSDESPALAPTPAGVAVVSMAEEIERLAELHARGILTDAEFASCKARLIGG